MRGVRPVGPVDRDALYGLGALEVAHICPDVDEVDLTVRQSADLGVAVDDPVNDPLKLRRPALPPLVAHERDGLGGLVEAVKLEGPAVVSGRSFQLSLNMFGPDSLRLGRAG
jgi:hypothetical protein